MHHRPAPPPLTTLLLLLLAICTLRVSASEGDRDPHYWSCLQTCQLQCASPPPPNTDPITKRTLQSISPVTAVPTHHLAPYERWTGWSCDTNCQYQCMWHNIQYRQHFNLPTVKYYGKWPFYRVYGMQELFSVLFSIANAIPHIYGAYQYSQQVSEQYIYRNWWLAYSCVSINTWIQSAIFHARDTLITERLDYFCASLGIVFASVVAVIRVCNIVQLKYKLAVAVPWLTLFLCHISYLHFIHFDYGYNMTMSLLSGVLYSAIWMVWCGIHRHRPYVWKMVACTVALWLAAMCEIFDFPPFYYLLDAHAVWHGLTPPISALFYSFLIDDAKYELSKTHHKTR